MRRSLIDNGIGVLNTPDTAYSASLVEQFPAVALDNGCFSAKWDAAKWTDWLATQAPGALFAVVPDVVADADGTLARWSQWAPTVVDAGHVPAFVLQDGQEVRDVPWSECGAVFVGGSTAWKLSQHAERLVREAKRRGKWAHMGRVNSRRRLALAASWGCDSADGTFLAFGPDVNASRLVNMVRSVATQSTLFGGAA